MLRELNYIGADEVIEEHVQGDLWSFAGQTRGNFFFTRDKFVFRGGILGTEEFSIKYSDIKKLKLINIRFIMPRVSWSLRKIPRTASSRNINAQY